MSNKYVIIGVVLVVLMGGGALFSALSDTVDCPEGVGMVRDVTVVSKKLEWKFEPEAIEVEQCDVVNITVVNEDNFDHGFAIDAFGISQRLPANETIYVSFTATKAGEFPFYCSVSCSDSKATGNLPDGVVQTGPYAGTFRGHFEHIGKFIVSALKAVVGQ
jgi:nitrosocyanin